MGNCTVCGQPNDSTGPHGCGGTPTIHNRPTRPNLCQTPGCGHGFDQHSPYTPQPCHYQSSSTNALGSIITPCLCRTFTPAQPASEDTANHPVCSHGVHLRYQCEDCENEWVEAVVPIIAARTAALNERAERADRERDEAQEYRDLYKLELDAADAELAALRAAVTGLADEWEAKHHTSPSRARGSGPTMTFAGAANQLRALLTDEGDNQ